jgi:hypothetical protein
MAFAVTSLPLGLFSNAPAPRGAITARAKDPSHCQLAPLRVPQSASAPLAWSHPAWPETAMAPVAREPSIWLPHYSIWAME